MEAIAPAALALSVSLDAVASLGMVLMSYSGPFVKAMLPLTDDVRLNIAAGLGDLLLLTLLRGCLVMLPLLGLSATRAWLAAALTTVAAMTGWLAAKAALLVQLSSGKTLYITQTGVTLHLPTLVATEMLGVFMGWFLLALVWLNRRVMQQPAAGEPLFMALDSGAAVAMQQQRLAVQQWVIQQEPLRADGPELTAPLLSAAAAAAAEAGQVGDLEEGVEAAGSYVSARSRQGSNASWVTAQGSVNGAGSLAGVAGVVPGGVSSAGVAQ